MEPVTSNWSNAMDHNHTKHVMFTDSDPGEYSGYYVLSDSMTQDDYYRIYDIGAGNY